jgi:hypothetical protein
MIEATSRRSVGRMDARIRWIAAWFGGPVIGVANGTARELTYGRAVSERTAHQISTATALALFAGCFEARERRWPLPSRRAALEVGAAWAGLTVLFEFGFGHFVAHEPWRKLLQDYDLRRGRVWGLIPLWMALGPAAMRARERGPGIRRTPQPAWGGARMAA